MLVIEDNSVYEIDEECLRTRKVPKACHTMEKLYGKPKESRHEGPKNVNRAGNLIP